MKKRLTFKALVELNWFTDVFDMDIVAALKRMCILVFTAKLKYSIISIKFAFINTI